MSNEIIDFYSQANSAKKETTLSESVSSQPVSVVEITKEVDPFNNFLLELSSKLKEVKLDKSEKIQVLEEVVGEEDKVNNSEPFNNFLNDFQKIIDKEKIKKEEQVKDKTINFINQLKDNVSQPEPTPVKATAKELPKKFENKIRPKAGQISSKIENKQESNTYVDQLKNIDKTKDVPEKIKTKSDLRSAVTKIVKDEIEKYKVQLSRLALEGGGSGSVAKQFAKGGTMEGDLNVKGKFLSGGVDLLNIFAGGDNPADRLISGSQSVVLNTDGTLSFPNNFIVPPDGEILNIESETDTEAVSGFTRISLSPFGFFAYDSNNNSITFDSVDNEITIDSQNTYEWVFGNNGVLRGPFEDALAVYSLSSVGKILSAGKDLSEIFLTYETDAQTLNYTESSAELTISNGNTVSLSSLNDKSYVDANFLNLTGGVLGGNLTIQGNISALGTSTFANTIFTTTSALSVVNTGPGPALQVFQAAGPYDVASFYDGDGIEVLHVGNAGPGGLGKIGINLSLPNKELTVRGSISATESIFATSILSGGVDLADIFLTAETDSQTLTWNSTEYELSISNGNTVSLGSLSSTGGATPIKRFDYVTIADIDYSYSGSAPFGTLDDNPIWKLIRLTYNNNGTISNSASAIDSWTGHLTAAYI